MKNYNLNKLNKIIIFIFLIVLFNACKSPLEVPANREIDIKDNPYTNPLLKVNPTFVNFEFVHTDSTKILVVHVENNQDVSYPITDYHLFFANNNFKIINKKVPVILEPKGLEGSKFDVQIQFLGKTSGVYNDTILFNNIPFPTALLEAKVPYIYAIDRLINNALAGAEIKSAVIFKNLSENSVSIKSINFSQNSELFSFTDIFPIEVPRNSSKELHFTFLSNSPGTFSTNITFELITNSQRKLTDSVASINVVCK